MSVTDASGSKNILFPLTAQYYEASVKGYTAGDEHSDIPYMVEELLVTEMLPILFQSATLPENSVVIIRNYTCLTAGPPIRHGITRQMVRFPVNSERSTGPFNQ